jgi:hypothetical protein
MFYIGTLKELERLQFSPWDIYAEKDNYRVRLQKELNNPDNFIEPVKKKKTKKKRKKK